MSIFESIKLRLTIKSPVHIGSVEQKISRLEFIHHDRYIYPVSEEKLSLFLQKRNLISSYVLAIERDASRFNLAEFFKNKAIDLNAEILETLSGGRKIKVLSDASKIQEFRPFIRDGFGQVFIPGTSIKGVIRTALLYNILKDFKHKNPSDFKRDIEDRITNDIINGVNKRKFAQWANEEWLEDFVLSNKRRCQNTDWLRMIRVSDAYSSQNIETVLIPVNILKKEKNWNLKKESSGQDTTIWIECIPEHTVLEFEATLDKGLLADFKRYNKSIKYPDSLLVLLDTIKQWSADIFSFEKDFSKGHDLESWYKNNTANFRIGFGSGMVSTTIIILLDEDLRKKIRNYAGIDRGNEIAPKSRRVWLKDLKPVPLGWAIIEVIK